MHCLCIKFHKAWLGANFLMLVGGAVEELNTPQRAEIFIIFNCCSSDICGNSSQTYSNSVMLDFATLTWQQPLVKSVMMMVGEKLDPKAEEEAAAEFVDLMEKNDENKNKSNPKKSN